VPQFETQYEVVVDGRVLHLDFAWPDHMVGLEYMGKADHGMDQVDSDARRRGQLTAAGWRVLDATAGIALRDIVRWVDQALAIARRVQ